MADFVTQQAYLGEISRGYKQHQLWAADVVLREMEKKLGIKVLEKRSWRKYKRIVEIETASGKPMELMWQDNWRDWYGPWLNYEKLSIRARDYQTPFNEPEPRGHVYGGEFRLYRNDRPLKDSMFR